MSLIRKMCINWNTSCTALLLLVLLTLKNTPAGNDSLSELFTYMPQPIFPALSHLVIQVEAALLREEVHRVQVRVHHGHQLAQGQGFELAHGKQAVVQLGAKAPSEGNLGGGG